ncbi:hypothetical protein [Streptomyces carpinensis]|uniref:hypothetical protein n=1 Tax=Streptomyces carpinensis TaxID=66369 RepID=UPI000A399BA0|nr:hypothetical protein [Streptomyces carpinensis]
MEQRIGSSSQPLKNEPVTGAGFDPAFVPGLTGPASASPESEDSAPQPQDAAPEAEEARPEAGSPDPARTAEAEEAAVDGPEESDAADEGPDGPVFEAADRRARIVADHRGVRLSLDDQECEFRWDEIGAVETETPRFGKRFTVTVHTPERRWYPIEIEAPARSRFGEWEAQLDAVLDAYFDNGAADDRDGAAGEPDAADQDDDSNAADEDTAVSPA